MHLWVLGAGSATKVLSGVGLGPDLTVPVPYVMARRTGKSTAFVALMEPFVETPVVKQFQRISNDVYLVEGPDWKDTITVGAKVAIQHQPLAPTHSSRKKQISEVHQ
jgi:hypothetical protein